MKIALLTFVVFFSVCCGSQINPSLAPNPEMIKADGTTIESRFVVPEGFTRLAGEEGSMTSFLRKVALKPDGSTVKLFTGEDKPWQNVHVAVVDMEIGKKDLQQCADACIRLRAEYLWNTKQFEKIKFHLTNGFLMDYMSWRNGNRLAVNGNNTSWVKKAEVSTSHESFRAYLDIVFTYAGTLSVEKELKKIELKDMMPGDVFVVGGSPGHAVMVMDVAKNSTGQKVFLLGQGYMPAQEIHIIKNPNDPELSPWFSNQIDGPLETMEWTFSQFKLGRFE
jgi:hypothetical protein